MICKGDHMALPLQNAMENNSWKRGTWLHPICVEWNIPNSFRGHLLQSYCTRGKDDHQLDWVVTRELESSEAKVSLKRRAKEAWHFVKVEGGEKKGAAGHGLTLCEVATNIANSLQPGQSTLLWGACTQPGAVPMDWHTRTPLVSVQPCGVFFSCCGLVGGWEWPELTWCWSSCVSLTEDGGTSAPPRWGCWWPMQPGGGLVHI